MKLTIDGTPEEILDLISRLCAIKDPDKIFETLLRLAGSSRKQEAEQEPSRELADELSEPEISDEEVHEEALRMMGM